MEGEKRLAQENEEEEEENDIPSLPSPLPEKLLK
jgi:hypothetical protein